MGINGSANAVVTFNQRDFALGNSTGNGATTNQGLELMRRSNFALRLQPSLLEELAQNCGIGGSKPAHQCGRAEKVSALRTEKYFRERVAVPIAPRPRKFSRRKRNPPVGGDELPPGWQMKPGRKVVNERDSVSRAGARERRTAVM